jgi:hypothetical protein
MSTPPETPRSRPLLDEGKMREICAIMTVGGTQRMAADYVGCHAKTIRNTAKRDAEFAARLRRSELVPEITLLKAIQNAASDSKQWRAAAWALERLYPGRYGQRTPDTLTPQQVVEVLEEFLAVITKEIPTKRHRRRLWQRLDRLSSEVKSARSSKKLDASTIAP